MCSRGMHTARREAGRGRNISAREAGVNSQKSPASSFTSDPFDRHTISPQSSRLRMKEDARAGLGMRLTLDAPPAISAKRIVPRSRRFSVPENVALSRGSAAALATAVDTTSFQKRIFLRGATCSVEIVWSLLMVRPSRGTGMPGLQPDGARSALSYQLHDDVRTNHCGSVVANGAACAAETG